MSSVIVQKYGGSSVADLELVRNVARRIVETKKKGHPVVVVVSAMGQTTDELLEMAYQITSRPDEREVDMLLSSGEQISIALLAMAIHSLGCEAISFTGAQVGIVTDNRHTKARIIKINPDKIKRQLRKGNIVIIAGFQGIDFEQNITTLGRGGSDTTAVALAAVLKAKRCEIYTDVEGVYTADPHVIRNARRLKQLSYDEMLELAILGANVLQPRAVEFAAKYNVPLYVLNSFANSKGTLITKEAKNMEDVVVRSIAVEKKQAKITILQVPDKPGIAARIFKQISDTNVNIDMIVQNVGEKGTTDVSFTVVKDDLRHTQDILKLLIKKIGAKGVLIDKNMAKVSIVGIGMRGHSGVAARMFKALARRRINIEMISTSEIKISCVIGRRYADKAAQALHKEFKLGE